MRPKYIILVALTLIHLNLSRQDFIGRNDWGARPPKHMPSKIPMNRPNVFIHHTHIPKSCFDQKSCAKSVRGIQNAHQRKGWNDIGYSFLIGQDGNVYEGRGWGVQGSHTSKNNRKGYGIAFIGDFRKQPPSPASIKAAQNLINEGVKKGYISKDYTVQGHRDVSRTSCPGQKLYDNIKSWPRNK